MKSNKKFAEWQVALAKEIYDIYESKVNRIARAQKVSKQAVMDVVARIMLEQEVDSNGVLVLSLASKSRLKRELNKVISEVFKTEYEAEKGIISDILKDLAENKYYSNCYLYSLGVSYTVKPVTDAELKKIINKEIKGEVWSDRVWENKNKVAKQLKVEIFDFLNRKTDINSIGNRISKRFDVNWNNSKRLFYTEVANVQTQANEVWAKKHGIKKQMFMATLDFKTSVTCRDKDGKVYDYDDSSKPIPPLHPYCRSCLVNIVDEKWRPKYRMDNMTKQRINYETYREWYEKQDLK